MLLEDLPDILLHLDLTRTILETVDYGWGKI